MSSVVQTFSVAALITSRLRVHPTANSGSRVRQSEQREGILDVLEEQLILSTAWILRRISRTTDSQILLSSWLLVGVIEERTVKIDC